MQWEVKYGFKALKVRGQSFVSPSLDSFLEPFDWKKLRWWSILTKLHSMAAACNQSVKYGLISLHIKGGSQQYFALMQISYKENI